MPITASFSTSQSVGSPSEIILTDSSTGSDGTAVSRRVYLVNAAGEYITESGTTTAVAYTEFPLADGSSITLDVLDFDMALYVTLTYNNVSGGVVATVTNLRGFTLYNRSFYYTLTQAQAMQNQPPPMIMQDSNYYMSKGILITEIESGDNAIEYGSDITSAQAAYDRATYMVAKQNTYF